MQGRTAAGIGAWVIGVTSATALSLVAVAVFRQDSTTVRGPVLSQSDVDRALSAASAASSATPSQSPSNSSLPSTVATHSPPTPSVSQASTSPPRAGTATTSASPTSPTSDSATTDAAPVSRVFSTSVATVVARCTGPQVYLVSWSPAQGYQTTATQRGPAKVAAVSFIGPRGAVKLRFWCSGGVPQSGGHGDDGGADS